MAEQKTKSALFITYDGLLDPLGASQILPYLRGVAASPRKVLILSFEKPALATSGAAILSRQLEEQGIGWRYVSFTSGYGALGKAWDLARMYLYGLDLARKHRIEIVHTRGTPASQVGYLIKRVFGAKFIFDFRGLWSDERIDKGLWNLDRLADRLQYRYFKATERTFVKQADEIVVLTRPMHDEVVGFGAPSSKITVIPCCADFNHFVLATNDSRTQARDRLGIPQDSIVFGYLGSIGKMYRLDRFFRLFEIAKERLPDAVALLITPNIEEARKSMQDFLRADYHESVQFTHANRDQVPLTVPAMDVLVSFIQPSYARKAASPTKLAECFAAGVPAICNPGVGDVTYFMSLLRGGMVVDAEDDSALAACVDAMDRIKECGGPRLREAAEGVLGLQMAVDRYRSVYARLD